MWVVGPGNALAGAGAEAKVQSYAERRPTPNAPAAESAGGGDAPPGAARSLPALLVDNLRGDGHDDGDIACVPPPALVRKRPHAVKVRQIEREHLASRRWERAADAGKYAPPRRLAAALIA